MSDKTCLKCNTTQPLTEFHRHPHMADGHLNKCRTCRNLETRERRAKDPERYRNYDRALNKTPQRKEQYAAYRRTPAGKAARSRRERAYRERDPEKFLARSLTGKAIRDGSLERQPCERCGSRDNIHAHHDDYSRPLDVTWLCHPCHVERHRPN